MRKWAIVNAATKVAKILTADSADSAAANTPAGGTAVELTQGLMPAVGDSYTGGRFVAAIQALSAEDVLQNMLATIDSEAEGIMMSLLTAGGAKKYEYANKAREVRDYRTLGDSALVALLLPLNLQNTRERFAWSMAEAEDTGDSLATVISRYETALQQTILVRRVAARAQKLKRGLRAASTSAARAAIFNSRSWPT